MVSGRIRAFIGITLKLVLKSWSFSEGYDYRRERMMQDEFVNSVLGGV